MQATPNSAQIMEAHMSFCVNCNGPVVSINGGNSEAPAWSDWTHALTGQVDCVVGVPEPPGREE